MDMQELLYFIYMDEQEKKQNNDNGGESITAPNEGQPQNQNSGND